MYGTKPTPGSNRSNPLPRFPRLPYLWRCERWLLITLVVLAMPSVCALLFSIGRGGQAKEKLEFEHAIFWLVFSALSFFATLVVGGVGVATKKCGCLAFLVSLALNIAAIVCTVKFDHS